MASWLLRMVKGALIGIGAILPGISGGVLSVVLGIYKPMMAFLAHPIKTFRQNAMFFLPVLVGWAVGVMLLARVVDWFFSATPDLAIWLFIGLVVGTLPTLWKETGEQGRPAWAWVALVVAGVVMGGILLFFGRGGTQVTPNTLWWVFCGVLWGLGLVVPGLSPSSFFIFFGLYQPMTAAIGRFDLTVILPMAVGLVAAVALLAKGMHKLLEKAYSYTMHAIFGIVIASTIAIFPSNFLQALPYLACFVAGCAIALAMGWMSKLKPAGENKPKEAEPAEEHGKAAGTE